MDCSQSSQRLFRTLTHTCLLSTEKAVEECVSEPGCQWLAAGDKENKSSENVGKCILFYTLIYDYCKYEQRNVHMAQVQKGVEPNENFDLMGSETMGNVNLGLKKN